VARERRDQLVERAHPGLRQAGGRPGLELAHGIVVGVGGVPGLGRRRGLGLDQRDDQRAQLLERHPARRALGLGMRLRRTRQLRSFDSPGATVPAHAQVIGRITRRSRATALRCRDADLVLEKYVNDVP
jgi:hypothetical protein